MPTVSIYQPIPSNTLLAHIFVFAIHFTTSFLWVSSIAALQLGTLLLIAALVSWLTLRSPLTIATLLIMATVFVRYWIWEASDSWYALSRIAVTTCFLVASRVRFCEILQRVRSIFESDRHSDQKVFLKIRQESWALFLWTTLIVSYSLLASVLIFQTVGSGEDWLTWGQENRVVLWLHPTLIVLGLFTFLCFKRWQWSTTVVEQCRLLLRREAIQILDPDLHRIARIRASVPQPAKDPESRHRR